MTELKSNIDSSVNYITKSDKGFFESRYVNRGNGYFICYLSSHNGCNQLCKFCHLTSSKQFFFNQARVVDYVNQADRVFRGGNVIEKKVHFNFMARGEPLLNDDLIGGRVISSLERIFVKPNNIKSNYLVSTIFPKKSPVRRLSEWFGKYAPMVYFSYYSSNPNFREKWLPSALPENIGISMIDVYNKDTGVKSKLHFALIENQNDNIQEIDKLCEYIDRMSYIPEINLIRYNPNCSEYKESKNIELFKEVINRRFGNIVKIIPRVGYDVKASCGMFIESKNVLSPNM